jgi:cytochrome b
LPVLAVYAILALFALFVSFGGTLLLRGIGLTIFKELMFRWAKRQYGYNGIRFSRFSRPLSAAVNIGIGISAVICVPGSLLSYIR